MEKFADSAPYSPSLNERLSNLLSNATYKFASCDESLDEIQRLRYSCYLGEGIIDENAECALRDIYDQEENTYNFSVYVGEKIVSAIRIHVVSRECPKSPSMSSFSDVLEPYLLQEKTLIDPTRFVVS